jgi:hypothetical protein
MLVRPFIIVALAAASVLLAGCADTPSLFNSSSNNLTTSSVAPPAAPRVDPACSTLSSQIDGLRKEGITEKVEKASLKKYKLTTAELVKADQLNKANADFQNKCGTVKPMASVTPAATPAVTAASTAAAANSARSDASAVKGAVTAAAAVAKQ